MHVYLKSLIGLNFLKKLQTQSVRYLQSFDGDSLTMSSSDDSGPEDRNPSKEEKKRGKPSVDKGKKEPATKRKKTEEKNAESDDEFGEKILLGSKRFVSVSEFRGKKLIDIREWYGDEDLKPGKKGISLSKEQFEKLLAVGPKILKKVEEDD